MTETNFNSLHTERKAFIFKNKNKDHAVIVGNNNILLSSPHGVSQVRLGKFKFSEIGSLATALFLQKETGCHLIAKTKNKNDDANFDEKSPYKNTIKNIVKKHDIKYLIDIHGLAAKRPIDVNLGTHLGQNIKTNEKLLYSLYSLLKENGFSVSIDQPFMAAANSISSSMKKEFNNLWTLQIEINCAITNLTQNFEKYKKLLLILTNWIKNIKTNG